MTSTETSTANSTEHESYANSRIAWKVSTWNNHAVLLFQGEAPNRGLAHVARDEVATTSWSIDILGEFARLVDRSDGPEVGPPDKAWTLRHSDRHITLIHIYDGFAHVASAADDLEIAQATCSAVAEQIRSASVEDAGLTPVTFWGLNPNRWPRPMRRPVATHSWDEISPNYGTETCASMGRLLDLRACPDERMILWHGPSGTGKTHALRSLARAWHPWCDVAYITDPEEFIGGTSMPYSPTYLFDVANFGAGHGASAVGRSKLIVLEDAGELMVDEARKASGQGLSRMLNLTDGMMGQGLNVMVLITTNEPLGTLHPAVIRPGRCLAEIEFGPLSAEQANEWLAAHDSDARVEVPTTLAELYAMASGRLARPALSPALR